MGVIYINDGGFRKAKQPVSLEQTNVNISGGDQGLDISVEDGNMIVSSENSQLDNVVQDEILNIV